MADTYASVMTLPAPPDQVLQAFLTSLAASGAFVTLSGPNSIVVTRRYTPTWAIVVGIIGIFFFLIGVLAFFIKESEVLTLVLSPELGEAHESCRLWRGHSTHSGVHEPRHRALSGAVQGARYVAQPGITPIRWRLVASPELAASGFAVAEPSNVGRKLQEDSARSSLVA